MTTFALFASLVLLIRAADAKAMALWAGNHAGLSRDLRARAFDLYDRAEFVTLATRAVCLLAAGVALHPNLR